MLPFLIIREFLMLLYTLTALLLILPAALPLLLGTAAGPGTILWLEPIILP